MYLLDCLIAYHAVCRPYAWLEASDAAPGRAVTPALG